MSLKYCDGCSKKRNDVKSVGRDANGSPDAPDLCFLCRKENERGKSFDTKQGRYVYRESTYTGEYFCG